MTIIDILNKKINLEKMNREATELLEENLKEVIDSNNLPLYAGTLRIMDTGFKMEYTKNISLKDLNILGKTFNAHDIIVNSNHIEVIL